MDQLTQGEIGQALEAAAFLLGADRKCGGKVLGQDLYFGLQGLRARLGAAREEFARRDADARAVAVEARASTASLH
jgi:hypothetical protein